MTALDISATALEGTRTRLGAAAERVHWLPGDVTEVSLPEARFDVWHDRAVFHFLTTAFRARHTSSKWRARAPAGAARFTAND